MKTSFLWTVFVATWGVMLAFAGWSVSEHHSIRAQMAAIDKTQSIQMARLETELKQISTTLAEIKERLNHR